MNFETLEFDDEEMGFLETQRTEMLYKWAEETIKTL